jgi:hypothetical protein
MAVLLVGFGGSLSAAERWETLQAIHLIENPHNSSQPGSHGELGAYQFRRATWRMHTRKPFYQALIRAQADEVAVAHYDWICTQLRRQGFAVTTRNIAMVWNAGIGSVTSGRVPLCTRQYAQRVLNVARDLERSKIAASIPDRSPMERIVLSP